MLRLKIKAGCVIMAILLSFGLIACRDSPVLQQTVYTQSAPEIDETQHMLDPEDNGIEDEQFDNITIADTSTLRDVEVDRGLAQETGEMSESTQVEYAQTSHNEWQAEDTPSGPEAEETETGGTGAEVAENIAGDEATFKQVVDARGIAVNLPENVETVTAVGAAAQMVEMLAGDGRLIAADEKLLFSDLAMAAFEDHAAVQPWWRDDGSDGISDIHFSALLEAKPDACLEISGENTFSNAQVAQLIDSGIAYVVLPDLSSHSNLTLAVTLVGEILGGNAADIADSYNAWVDRTVREAGNATPSAELTSLYISGWDANAAYQLSGTKGVIDISGSGLAVAYSPTKAQLAGSFMRAANVINESTRLRSLFRDLNYVYVAPMFHQFSPVVSGEAAAFHSSSGIYGAAYDLFVARMISDTVYYQLGGINFPAIIVASPEIKAQIESNWFWQFHQTDANGFITIGGQSFYCGIVGDYDIHITPGGMYDWAEGSVESPLMAIWVAHKLHNAFSPEEVKEKTQEFYQEFFNVTLSEDQLSTIFETASTYPR